MRSPATDAGAVDLYRRLLGYAWPYKAVFAVAVVGMVGMAAAETSFAALLKPLMDGGFVERDRAVIQWIPVFIIGLFLVRGLAEFVATYCMNWVGRRVVFDLRNDMFKRMVRLPAAFYDGHSSAGLVSKLIYDVEQTASATTNALNTVIKDTLTALALLGWMLYLSWQLTLVFIVVAPLAVVMVRAASKRFRSTSRRIQASVGGIARVAKEAFQGHKIVKAFGAQPREIETFRRENNRNRQQAMKRATVQAASVPLLVLVAGVAVAAVIYIATAHAGDGVTAGAFVSYLGATLLLLGPVRRLARVNLVVQTGIAAAGSVFAVMDEPPENDAGSLAAPRLGGHIRFEDVCFRYETKPHEALDAVSFEVLPGQTVALVGASGSGKSTAAALLLRLYTPQRGVIRVDGTPISEMRLAEYRDNFAVVTQEVVLFDDSIRNNIVYGHRGEVDAERLEAVVGVAHVDEFAAQLPDGLDTLVGEQGARLSGGQRQRIAIARALYKDAPILVLDEATSSLDARSEQLVHEATQRLMQGRTTLVIAHRLSTVEQADRIVVLAEGRVVESGRHEELMERGGIYATLYRAQVRKAVVAAV